MKSKTGSFFPFLFFILIFLPGLAMAQANHDGNHCVAAKSPFRLAMDSGKVIYIQRCLSCHQEDGSGIVSVNPPLTRKEVMGDKNKLIKMVIEGLDTHEGINGISYSNVMPPNPNMTDQEIADLLTYIRNSFGNNASAVKSKEVKSLRSKLKSSE
jgi:mono/diheme cytochrome c family protein